MNQTFLTSESATKEEYKKIIAKTAEAISNAFVDDRAYSGPTPDELKKIIAQDTILPEKGLGFEKVFELTKEKVLPNLLRTPSSDYMAHLHGPSLVETIASELIISTFNQSMDSWDQSPVATEIEMEVTKHLCSLYGYDTTKADGVFTSGGSQSNQTAIILARDWFCNQILNYDVKKNGLNEKCSKLRMYTSEISHFSMEKSAHILGLGYKSVVKVPVDSRKKMDIKALRTLIEQDKKDGNIPFLIVGTVGTTDFGSIDPLEELSQIARENNMWLHADAAYGSGVIMSSYKERVSALHLCDSITVDFHKMFLMPISCSAVLVKDGSTFDALTIHADYLNREEDEEDGYSNLVDKSLQTTRRFDALKVWVSFQSRGKDGWAKLIDTSLQNAQYFYTQLKADSDFAVVTEPEISSVVFRYTGALSGTKLAQNEQASRLDEINKKVRRALIHEHGIVIGQTISDGFTCLKFTLLNPLITHEKLDELKALIKELAEKN
ncbi:MAG: aspartate aminotransferase family protein [Treponema sp.]|nr:aspartate aminotransferase family protein [Treponema sp.]